MRIQILVDVGQDFTLPVNYNNLLVGVIYRYLGDSNPEYADFLHDEGYRAAQKRFKLFTFSRLLAKHRRIIDGQIHFGSTITWYVSSPVEKFLSHFADTLLTEGRLSIGQHELKVKDVSIPRTPKFQSNMRFRCLSPIVMSAAREHEGKRRTHYCLQDDPELSQLIRQNLIRKHEAVYGSISDDALSFRFDEDYIRRSPRRITQLVDFKGIKIRGVLCPFYVSGSTALIRVGYECGFGDKNSIGFGMAEL